MKRRLLVPERIQTSAMDCGPCALESLLDAFDVPVDFESLRERCQTEVDGTSIDDLESVARGLGLDVEQTMLPVDALLEQSSMPAIVVTRLPSRLLHFIVVWNTVGPFVQVMDPSSGRRWMRRGELRSVVFQHRQTIPAEGFRAWAVSEAGLAFLQGRLEAVGVETGDAKALLGWAAGERGWVPFAALDAAARMVASLDVGARAGALVKALVEGILADAENATSIVPERLWTVVATDDPHEVEMRGAVLLRVASAQPRVERVVEMPGAGPHRTAAQGPDAALARGVVDADQERKVRGLRAPAEEPLRRLWHMIAAEGRAAIGAVVATILAAAFVSLVDALALRGVVQATQTLGAPSQRIAALCAILVFVALSFALDVPVNGALQRLGRGLECRLRAAIFEKLPRLEDRYVRGRPTSDFVSRAHAMHVLRNLPDTAAHALRSALTLLVTAGAIAWIAPACGALALLAAALAVGVPLLIRRFATEQSLRMQTHAGALGRFYLDALTGLVAMRAHGAERAVAREHEGLLVEWARAAKALHGTVSLARALQLLLTMALSVSVVVCFVACGGESRMLLLVAYWALRLPQAGQELATSLAAYPSARNAAVRLFEPLGAAEIEEADVPSPAAAARGVEIVLEGVTARAMGHTVLHDVSLALRAGEHVAIVGPSGGGKSSLLSLLLGWLEPSEGALWVDGMPLAGAARSALHARTAWVDPSIQLFTRSLLDNVTYGSPPERLDALPAALRAGDLEELLERMPEGMQTVLGEGGSNVSGGQGQRVRFARAAMRSGADLVLLDEAFRGLDRERRRVMCDRARKLWSKSTLLFVTHDVCDAKHFDRVLVVEGGRVVENGSPAELVARPSRFRQLLEAEVSTRRNTWGDPRWQRIRVEGGCVSVPQSLEVDG